MHPDIQEVLISEEEIAGKVKELAARITEDYRGEKVLMVGIIKGAVIFLSDLIRHIEVPVNIDFMAVSSYGKASRSSGVVKILKDLDQSIENRHVIVVEDIVDTGLTLKYMLDNLTTRKPATLKTCTLLDKPSRRKVKVVPDYNGFTIPDKFVVGYGLDYAENYRNLREICVLKPEVYTKG
ncbi:MAG: hypoxanthine phosphoribosyltransferase [Peptococcaceae bacterium BICA1-7]|nr:MAG: hypoxanthine phosphoribosyltransferase [Peptococcaceae bacterium BICA1-7]HBV96633.1 hypoxanthine phosphoribosyltransferase [Desulfotomaculum sp.]